MAIQRMTGARHMQKCKIVTKEGIPIDMSKMATVGSLTVMKRHDQKNKEKLKSHVCFHVSIMILVALLSTTVMVVAAATILNEEYGNLFGNGTMIFGRNSTIYTEQPTPTSSRRIVIFLNTSEISEGQFVITSITSDDLSAESLANYFGVDKDNQKCKLIVDQIALLAFSALVILGLILPGLKKISIAYLLIWFYSVSLLAYVCVIYTNTAYETKKSQIFFRGFDKEYIMPDKDSLPAMVGVGSFKFGVKNTLKNFKLTEDVYKIHGSAINIVLVFAMFSLMTFVMQDAKGNEQYFEPQKVYVVVDKNMKVRKLSKRTSNPPEAKTDTIGSQTETTAQPQNDLNVKLPENLV